MNLAPKISVPVILCVAALSFAAGRMAVRPSEVESSQAPAAPLVQREPDRQMPSAVPDHVQMAVGDGVEGARVDRDPHASPASSSASARR